MYTKASFRGAGDAHSLPGRAPANLFLAGSEPDRAIRLNRRVLGRSRRARVRRSNEKNPKPLTRPAAMLGASRDHTHQSLPRSAFAGRPPASV
jgi:hypothetical protein